MVQRLGDETKRDMGLSEVYTVELERALWSIIEGALTGRRHTSRCRDTISQVWTGVGPYERSVQKARSGEHVEKV